MRNVFLERGVNALEKSHTNMQRALLIEQKNFDKLTLDDDEYTLQESIVDNLKGFINEHETLIYQYNELLE